MVAYGQISISNTPPSGLSRRCALRPCARSPQLAGKLESSAPALRIAYMSSIKSSATYRSSQITTYVLTCCFRARSAFSRPRKEESMGPVGQRLLRAAAGSTQTPEVPHQSHPRLSQSPESFYSSSWTQQRWAERSIRPFLALYISSSYHLLIPYLCILPIPLHRSAHRRCVRWPGMAFRALVLAVPSLQVHKEATRFSNIGNRAPAQVTHAFSTARSLHVESPNPTLQAAPDFEPLRKLAQRYRAPCGVRS